MKHFPFSIFRLSLKRECSFPLLIPLLDLSLSFEPPDSMTDEQCQMIFGKCFILGDSSS